MHANLRHGFMAEVGSPYTPFTPRSAAPAPPQPDFDLVGHLKYLEEQGLDQAVSAALMTAVNERARNGKRRVAELLLLDAGAPVSTPAPTVEETPASTSDTERELRAQLEVLKAEVATLKAKAKAPPAEAATLSVTDDYREMMARLFGVLDTDNSGELSSLEMRAFAMALGCGPISQQ